MSVPVINIAAMREWEAATWATGQTGQEVIRRVGKSVADCALKLIGNDDSILILAGKGNNGADARAAKEFLGAHDVKLLNVTEPETDLPRLTEALKDRPALIIDGLFGIGLNRELSEPWRKVIETVNDSGVPVLAVDISSGLNGDTGAPMGAAIKADVTLTVGAPKTGMLATQAEGYIGRLQVADNVGLVPCPVKSEINWVLPADFGNFPPRRLVASHKGSYGHVIIVAGSLGYHGAAVLAVRGAQRAQPGLATVYTMENVYYPVATQLQSAMAHVWRPDLKFPEKISALLVGPGLAAKDVPDTLRKNLHHWWRDLQLPVVVDASGLDFLAAGLYMKRSLRVLTPHPGEAARLLNWTTEKVQANRLAALRELSRKAGNCWVVLKGYQTLIGRSEGNVFINSSGNPHLAQGGSGDLLGGFIAGLLAQPDLQKDIGKTLCYAVWQHGAAADQLQSIRKNWTVEDLANELGNSR